MIAEIVENNLKPSDDFIYGFANLHGLLDKEFEEYPYGISIAKKLNNEIVDAIKDGPTIEYLDHYKEVNNDLNTIATAIANELNKNGIKSISIIPTISSTSEEFRPYLEALRYKISHKMVATRAGLGWIGKTDLFISKDYGSRVRLVSILVDKPLEINHQTINASRCGKCNICVKKCPAQAANGKSWDIYTDRDVFFDARKCRKNAGN